jgi:hypothetical protein
MVLTSGEKPGRGEIGLEVLIIKGGMGKCLIAIHEEECNSRKVLRV